MQSKWWFIIGLLGCIVVIAGSYIWATTVMDSMYAYRSPLKEAPPAPGTALRSLLPPETTLPRRLVFVLIDALRWDTAQDTQVMPFLNALREEGAWAKMHSRPPSYSEPGYTVLFTGAWPELSDGPTLNLDYADIPTWTQDNLFSAARRAGLRTAVSAYYWFEKLIPQADVDYAFYTAGEDAAADRAVVDAALPWLQEHMADFVLIHIDQVDYAGHHEGGPRDPRWNAAARRADDLLQEIVATLDLTQDTLLVVSDHGQIDRGGHGGNEAVVLTEPFLLAGAGVQPGVYGDIQMVDVAPTLAVLLGSNIPASAQGFPRLEMLDLSATAQSVVREAVAAQQSALAEAFLAQIGAPQEVPVSAERWEVAQESMQAAVEKRLRAERLPRSLLAIVLAAVPAYLLLRRRAPDVVAWFLASLAYLALFHLRYAFLEGRTYSLSSVSSAEDIIFFSLITSGVSFLIVWLGFMAGRRVFARGAGAAAQSSLALSYTSLYLTALPILVSFALNGLRVTWTLPHFTTFFLAFLSLLQCLGLAVVGLLACALAALWGWAYAVRRRSAGEGTV